MDTFLYFSGGLLMVLGVGWFVESGGLRGPESLRCGITRQLKVSSELIDSIQRQR